MNTKVKNTLRSLYHLVPLPLRIKQRIKKTIFTVYHSFLYVFSYFTTLRFSACPLQNNHDLPDILVFSVINWSFRFQRPQHLAKALAQKGHRVFYISCSFEVNARPGFRPNPLDEALPLYEIKLFHKTSLVIYHHILTTDELNHLKKGMRTFFKWTGEQKTLSIVDHPFWTPLAFALPNNDVIYDCMDHHAGFANTSPKILQLEEKLFTHSALVLTSSQILFHHAKSVNTSVALIRNATDYTHFSARPDAIYTDAQHRKIIGYYGAIAEWFDIGLIAQIAQTFPDHLILLVGNDTVGAQSKLSQFINIIFTGEVPYQKLPYYLYAFDICLIPFLINPLTEATNPVKVYEYLSAGKPVVSVDLPELRELSHLVTIGHSPTEFCHAIQQFLDNPGNSQPRQTFAATQTWENRIQSFEEAVANIHRPFVSIIVLTYNNLSLTKECLNSIEQHTLYPRFEIIIVDNASTDGTREYLKTLTDPRYKIILNEENKGFAGGNNCGIRVASGDYIVLLNNDTQVTSGWLLTLVNHCVRNPEIGLLGPATDNIGNEAKIAVSPFLSSSRKQLLVKQTTLNHMGELIPMETLAFFCVMIPRKIIDTVGLLNEEFGLGFFEDDDYCRRVEASGYKIFCAYDVFVLHKLSASFDQIDNQLRQQLFEKNKRLYEKTWGPWKGHRHSKKDTKCFEESSST